MKDGKNIIVIGAVNIDICGKATNRLLMQESNIGMTTFSYGGVGRNIAEIMCRLGYNVKLITAFGTDTYSKQLKSDCVKIGIDISDALTVNGARCSTYISILDNTGEMHTAINDMAIYENLDTKFISTKRDILQAADLIILDANIPEETIEYVCSNVTCPIAADTVSKTKAPKFSKHLNKLAIIKPNIFEASSLSGARVSNTAEVIRAGEVILKKGCKNVLISMGDKGVYYSDGKKFGVLDAWNVEPTENVSGCGDAFLAAACMAYLNGEDIKAMAISGLCAARLSAKSAGTISREINSYSLDQMIKKYYEAKEF